MTYYEKEDIRRERERKLDLMIYQTTETVAKSTKNMESGNSDASKTSLYI
jgi:hypothetical protein